MTAQTVQLVEGGHLFYAADYDPNEVDNWIVGYDYHNGPGCALCHDSWCHHCEPDRETEACPALLQPALLGISNVLTTTVRKWAVT